MKHVGTENFNPKSYETAVESLGESVCELRDTVNRLDEGEQFKINIIRVI